jgi:hypothetical protein
MALPDNVDRLTDHREELRMSGEPLRTERREVLDANGVLYVNITEYARETLDVGGDDTVRVHTYPDGLEIEVIDGGGRE